MKKLLRKYLLKSGYGKFIDTDDLYSIDFNKVNNKSFVEISEPGDIFIMIQGHMDIYFPDKHGKNHLLARVYTDDYQLGGTSKHFLQKDSSMDNYQISLSSNSICYGINKKKIKILFNDPSFLSFIFERHIRFTNQIMQENYLRNIFSIEEYIAYILYNHAREGVYEVSGYSLFANLLKCDRTTLYRVIISLENRGILKKDDKLLRIHSMEQLKFIFDEKL